MHAGRQQSADLAPGPHSCARQDTGAVLRAGNSSFVARLLSTSFIKTRCLQGFVCLFVHLFLNTDNLFPNPPKKTPIEQAHFLSASILVTQWEEGTRWGDLYSS